MPELSRDEVAHLADLARIEMDDAELDHLAPQLSVILESVASIQGVAGDDVPPTSHPLPLTNVFRDDVVAALPDPGAGAVRRPGAGAGPVLGAAHPGGRAVTHADRGPRPSSPTTLTSGATTSVELTQAHLDRIAEVDDAVHAFLHVDAEGALAQAAESDARRAAGDCPRRRWTACRSRSRTCWPPRGCPRPAGPGSSRAGCRRTTPRWSPGCARPGCRSSARPTWTSSRWAPRPSTRRSAPRHNPWDLDRIPGGSGGGSAAAVASYEAPFALGTDTGGSIRQPGAVTGTVGMKPTYGGVSRYGLVALANSLDQVGPVTRTVLDAALLHEVIGGHDPTRLHLDRRAGRRARRRGATGRDPAT